MKELKEKVTIERSFTTNDKGWKRPPKTLPSKKLVIEFCGHLADVGLVKNVSHETLMFEFTTFFGSNDHRTLDKYIGRTEWVQRIIPHNKRKASFTVKYPPKRGLIEILGYATRNEDNTYTIHSEFDGDMVEKSNDDARVCIEGGGEEREEREREFVPHTISRTIHTRTPSLEKQLSKKEQLFLRASREGSR